MKYRVSFIVDDEKVAQAFVEDAHKTDKLIAYITAGGDDVEIQTSYVGYEEVAGA